MLIKGAIYFLQSQKMSSARASKCGIPILFLCIQSRPGAEQLKGDFYLPRYFNKRLSKSAHIRRGTTIQTCRRGNTEANVKLMT